MKQVTWPTKKQLRKDTLVVIETSILFAGIVLYHGYCYPNGIWLDF